MRSIERSYSGFPQERTKPTKKEIKKGGGKFNIRSNRKRNSESWPRELERARKKRQQDDYLLTIVLNSVIMHNDETND